MEDAWPNQTAPPLNSPSTQAVSLHAQLEHTPATEDVGEVAHRDLSTSEMFVTTLAQLKPDFSLITLASPPVQQELL